MLSERYINYLDKSLSKCTVQYILTIMIAYIIYNIIYSILTNHVLLSAALCTIGQRILLWYSRTNNVK